MEEKEFNVDEALNRLEEINKSLSAKDIELKASMELYREGAELAVQCSRHLEGVEKTLQIINEETAETK
ncbi:MAG: exodeoxyribonuclease VII small subunit [Lachnospiraceae bacterium]|nr:exodeoxyribonuclease VII small subunit [Lachnospiraceae bacterium]